MQVRCPACESAVNLGADAIGKTVPCPVCDQPLTIQKPTKKRRQTRGVDSELEPLEGWPAMSVICFIAGCLFTICGIFGAIAVNEATRNTGLGGVVFASGVATGIFFFALASIITLLDRACRLLNDLRSRRKESEPE